MNAPNPQTLRRYRAAIAAHASAQGAYDRELQNGGSVVAEGEVRGLSTRQAEAIQNLAVARQRLANAAATVRANNQR